MKDNVVATCAAVAIVLGFALIVTCIEVAVFGGRAEKCEDVVDCSYFKGRGTVPERCAK